MVTGLVGVRCNGNCRVVVVSGKSGVRGVVSVVRKGMVSENGERLWGGEC